MRLPRVQQPEAILQPRVHPWLSDSTSSRAAGELYCQGDSVETTADLVSVAAVSGVTANTGVEPPAPDRRELCCF